MANKVQLIEANSKVYYHKLSLHTIKMFNAFMHVGIGKICAYVYALTQLCMHTISVGGCDHADSRL